MIYIFIFIFGAIIGSFLNVVILRYNTGESVVYSGSRCFSCGKKLTWSELIPIFSFLIQKGRCRQCKSKISPQYPIVELITALVFCAIFWKLNHQFDFYSVPSAAYWLAVFGSLIVISVYDFRHQIIPDKIVYLLIFLAFGHWLFADKSLSGFLVGAGFFGFLGLLWLISRGRWMGLGDAKIALASGWLLGPFGGLIALFMSFWLGAISGIFLLIFAPKKFKLESRIPFGPFLGLGTLIAFLFGNNILQIYLNIAGRI